MTTALLEWHRLLARHPIAVRALEATPSELASPHVDVWFEFAGARYMICADNPAAARLHRVGAPRPQRVVDAGIDDDYDDYGPVVEVLTRLIVKSTF